MKKFASCQALFVIFLFASIVSGCGSATEPPVTATSQPPIPSKPITATATAMRTEPATSAPTATETQTPAPVDSATSTPLASTVTATYSPTETDSPSPTPINTPKPLPASAVKMALVPAGKFTMGVDVNSDNNFANIVDLPAFTMDVYEVTNGLYRACVTAGKCAVPASLQSFTRPDYFLNPAYDRYPVVQVDWNMARAYCEWRGARLPTEAEWEKAARGTDGRLYSWGNTADPRFDSADDLPTDTAAVGSYALDKSPYGIYDMAGNVSEWVSSLMKAYPYNANDGREDPNPEDSNSSSHYLRVIRGGSWRYSADAAFRGDSHNPFFYQPHLGFRCARSSR